MLTLIDDIAAVLDDVAVLIKVRTREAAGGFGDELALNAQQLSGVSVARELPVVRAVAKGAIVKRGSFSFRVRSHSACLRRGWSRRS